MSISNGEFSKKQRIDVIKQFCERSNILMSQDINVSSSPFVKFSISLESVDYDMFLYLKNIGNSGWSNKPFIRRIQIRALDYIPENRNGCLCALVGLCNGENEPIVAFWNPFLYTFHKKNRSAYLLEEQINAVNSMDFFDTEYAGKKILISSSSGFKNLLKKYIKDNYID